MFLVADIKENDYREQPVESRAARSQERDEDARGRGMFDEKNGKQLKRRWRDAATRCRERKDVWAVKR